MSHGCKNPMADNSMMKSHIAVGIVIDLVLLFLPVWIIYTNMLLSKRMVQAILVFCVGVFAVSLGIARMVLILTINFTVDAYVTLRSTWAY